MHEMKTNNGLGGVNEFAKAYFDALAQRQRFGV